MSDNKDLPPAPLANQLRALRQARRWSLAEAARRAGTSAPALHRYESGWDRFELRTLRRLAAALGARLEVRLVPTGAETDGAPPGRTGSPLSPTALAELLAPLFWDRELTPSDLEQYPQWVIRRVIMYGALQEVTAIRRFYGDDLVQRAAEHRSVDRRTRSYWRVVAGGGFLQAPAAARRATR